MGIYANEADRIRDGLNMRYGTVDVNGMMAYVASSLGMGYHGEESYMRMLAEAKRLLEEGYVPVGRGDAIRKFEVSYAW